MFCLAPGKNASGHPQHLGGDSFDCCTERYEIVVYCINDSVFEMLNGYSLTYIRYIERFPGLIHFIYVNRRTNQVMAPALNITHDDNNTTHDATQLLKEKVNISDRDSC